MATLAAAASIITIIGAGAAVAGAGYGLAKEMKGSALERQESRRFYKREIARIEAKKAETKKEATRQIDATREEGVMGLKEQGAQAAYESRMAMTQTELITSGEESKLGKSGVRMGGSPLLAAQQNVDLASAAADRTVERGTAGIALGGFKLGTGLQGIQAQQTMLTAEFERQRKELSYRRGRID